MRGHRSFTIAAVMALAACEPARHTIVDPPGSSTCGDGAREGTEQCDGADLASQTCLTAGFTGGTLACATDCTFVTGGCTGTGPTCGDGAASGFEQCDGTDLRGADCTTLGYGGGTLACAATCAYDATGCTGPAPVCGDGVAAGLEKCDGTDLRGSTCDSLGFAGGTLACDSSCRFVTSGCTPPSCGDGIVNQQTESCDGNDIGTGTCVSLGFVGGTLACDSSCQYVTSGCTPASCGDGIVNQPTESCDGNDLGTATCASLGFTGGNLTCTASCEYSTLLCFGSTATCGDGVATGPEPCDGTDLRGETCVSQGYTGGTLACTAGCALDFGACTGTGPVCGDGVKDGGESCDGADLGGLTCVSLGFTGGTLACTTGCTLDVSGCTMTSTCGDGQATGLEVCDGADLRGVTCAQLGLGSGSLACNATCDGFDTSGCSTAQVCGDGNVTGTEVCDGTNLNGASCQSFGYSGGTATCMATCAEPDLSQCTGAPAHCGNNRATGLEQCDGADLGSATCQSLGFAGGTLGCNANCSFDVAACTL